MPVIIPIIAAAASYGGTAALIGGTITVANVAAGLTMLGSILSIAGTVTKNEKLTKIGNGLMLVGGATSLVNSLAGGTAAGATSANPVAADASLATEAGTTGKIASPAPLLDTAASPGADLLTPPVEPLQGQGALLDASNPGAQATNSVAAVQNPVAPSANAVNPAGNSGTPTTPKPGIIAQFLKDNAQGVTVLGQGIAGAYQAQQTKETNRLKLEEEQRQRDFEERRRQQFNSSVLDSTIQARPLDYPVAPNTAGNRSLIGVARIK